MLIITDFQHLMYSRHFKTSIYIINIIWYRLVIHNVTGFEDLITRVCYTSSSSSYIYYNHIKSPDFAESDWVWVLIYYFKK